MEDLGHEHNVVCACIETTAPSVWRVCGRPARRRSKGKQEVGDKQGRIALPCCGFLGSAAKEESVPRCSTELIYCSASLGLDIIPDSN